VIVQKSYDQNELLKANSPHRLSGSINNYFEYLGYISLKDAGATSPPDHVPAPLAKVFEEGSKCVAVGCCNAAGAMFRLCVDMATETLLPKRRDGRLDAFHPEKFRCAPGMAF
jgi:hypothetical protein